MTALRSDGRSEVTEMVCEVVAPARVRVQLDTTNGNGGWIAIAELHGVRGIGHADPGDEGKGAAIQHALNGLRRQMWIGITPKGRLL